MENLEKSYIIEIGLKENLFDAFGNEILNSIKELGFDNFERVFVYDVYNVYGDVSLQLVKQITKNILLDHVAHNAKIYKYNNKKDEKKPCVEVWYKKQVTDPVAMTAIKAIKDLGIKNDVKIRCGKKYVFSGNNIKKDMIRQISEKILANTLIHDYIIKGI